jgi:transposase InsO family protein
MPWSEASTMSLRSEFIRLAAADGTNVSALARRFGVSRKTAYKWLARYRAAGAAGLADRSRRPRTAPAATAPEVERAVLELRAQHPAWGGRKLRRRLSDQGVPAVPAASTITAILRRHGQLGPRAGQARAFVRFQHEAPNRLWQMDFKGWFAAGPGACHPLTVLDDHSRYLVGLFACPDERTGTVRARLTDVFGRYGLPDRILCDNGPPWGTVGADERHTELTVWLLRLGVGVCHGRPYHPQTQGKDERLHRTLAVEVLQGRAFRDLADCQRRYDAWREVYNHQRPHEALALDVPGRRYAVSPRSYPQALPPLEYHPTDAVRKVQADGSISFGGRLWRVGKAFRGQPVGVRATAADGVWAVYFGVHAVAQIEMRAPTEPV